MTSKSEIPDSLRVIFQLSLLGEITPDMRLIAIRVEEKALTIRFYLDKQPTSENIEAASIVGANVCAMGLDNIDSVKEECLFSQEPLGKLETLNGVVYARREPSM